MREQGSEMNASVEEERISGVTSLMPCNPRPLGVVGPGRRFPQPSLVLRRSGALRIGVKVEPRWARRSRGFMKATIPPHADSA